MNKKKKTLNSINVPFNVLIHIFTSKSLICKSRRCSQGRVSAQSGRSTNTLPKTTVIPVSS